MATWTVSELRNDTALLRLDGYESLRVFRRPGEDELSYDVVRVESASEEVEHVQAHETRGMASFTGRLTSEWPTSWSDDWDESTEGPKVPTMWSMKVGGVELDIEAKDAGGMALAKGQWIRCTVKRLTVWSGTDSVEPYYSERGSRKTIQKIYDYLVASGARSMHVARDENDHEAWVLWVRPVDHAVAAEVSARNIHGRGREVI